MFASRRHLCAVYEEDSDTAYPTEGKLMFIDTNVKLCMSFDVPVLLDVAVRHGQQLTHVMR